MVLGEKMVRLLQSQQRAQRWLARAVGLSPNSVSKIGAGGDTSYKCAIAMARALGVDANWLLDDDQDWPPPQQVSTTALSDTEVIEELARRRELVRRDIRSMNRKIRRTRAVELDRLAAKTERSEDEQATLEAGLRDLVEAVSLDNRLSWLDPDYARPALRPAYSVEKLIGDLKHLPEVLRAALDRSQYRIHAYDAAMRGVTPKPGCFLIHPGIGDLVARDDFLLDTNRHNREGFVPLLEDVTVTLPVRGDDGGYAEGVATRFVHYESDDRGAFACRVGHDCTTPGYPAGTIVVCEPNKDLNPVDDCAVGSADHPGTVDIVRGEGILSEHPEYKSPGKRQRSGASVYPVVARFPRHTGSG